MLNLLRGEYTLSENKDGTTHVHFLIVADVIGPIPQFIKIAIAKLIVEIALFLMKRCAPRHPEDSRAPGPCAARAQHPEFCAQIRRVARVRQEPCAVQLAEHQVGAPREEPRVRSGLSAAPLASG